MLISHITPDVLGVVLSHLVAILQPGIVLGALSGDGIATTIKDFIAPLLFLGVGIASMTFLFKRQMTQFFQFAAIAVLIGAFWFGGDKIMKSVGDFIVGLF